MQRAAMWLSDKHCKPIPVMKTGVSLCTFPNREKPVVITCNEKRFFPAWEKYTEKTLSTPCTGPVWDCSKVKNKVKYTMVFFHQNCFDLLF